MIDVDKRIFLEKERCLAFAREHRSCKLFVFGAGRIAKPLYLFLKESGVKVEAFCVSDECTNKKEESGINIVPISSLKKQKNIAFILGVNSRLNREITKMLNGYGFYIILHATQYTRYLGEYQYGFYMNPMMEITTKIGCSVNCRYCPQGILLKAYYQTGNEDKSMSFETFKKCVDKMPINTLIEFAGFTEPFLNKDCIKMIQYAKNKGYRVNLFTTLKGANKNIIEELKKIQFEEFVLHVSDVEGYANLPITEEYLMLIDSLVKAKKPNGDDFIDYVCSQGTIPIRIKECLGENVRVFISLTDRAGNLNDEHLFKKKNIIGSIQCELSHTINHNVLLPDGRVVLCAQDYGMKHVLGNLLTTSYIDVVFSKEAEIIKKSMSKQKNKDILCRNCSLAHNIDEK